MKRIMLMVPLLIMALSLSVSVDARRYPGFGGGGQAQVPEVPSPPSPFADIAARDTYYTSNPDELRNDPRSVYTVVEITGGSTFRWSGEDEPSTYDANQWQLLAAENSPEMIKTLYESNANTNAFTDNDDTAVASIMNLDPGEIPMSDGSTLQESGMTVGVVNGLSRVTINGELAPRSGGGLRLGQNDIGGGGNIYGGGSALRYSNTVNDTESYPITSLVTTAGSGRAFYPKFAEQRNDPSPADKSETFTGNPGHRFAFNNPLPGRVTKYTINNPTTTTFTGCNFTIWENGYDDPNPLFDFVDSNPAPVKTFDIPPGDVEVTPPEPIGFPPTGTRIFSDIRCASGNVQLAGQTIDFPIDPTNPTGPTEEVEFPYLEFERNFSTQQYLAEPEDLESLIDDAENINNAIRFTNEDGSTFDVTTSPFTRTYTDLGQGITTPGAGSINLTSFRAAWMEFHPNARNASAINLVSDLDQRIVFSMDASKLTEDVTLTITQANTEFSDGSTTLTLKQNHVLNAFVLRDIPTAPESPTNPNVIYTHQTTVDGVGIIQSDADETNSSEDSYIQNFQKYRDLLTNERKFGEPRTAIWSDVTNPSAGDIIQIGLNIAGDPGAVFWNGSTLAPPAGVVISYDSVSGDVTYSESAFGQVTIETGDPVNPGDPLILNYDSGLKWHTTPTISIPEAFRVGYVLQSVSGQVAQVLFDFRNHELVTAYLDSPLSSGSYNLFMAIGAPDGGDGNRAYPFNSLSDSLAAAAALPSGVHKQLNIIGVDNIGGFTNTSATNNIANFILYSPGATFSGITLADHATTIYGRVNTGPIQLADQTSVNLRSLISPTPSNITFTNEVHGKTKLSAERMESTLSIDFSGAQSGSNIIIQIDKYDGTDAQLDTILSTIPVGVNVSGWIGSRNLSTNYLENAITFSDSSTQNPSGTDAPMVVTFGAGGSDPSSLVTMSSGGILTINKSGPYAMPMRAHVARSGAIGDAELFIQMERSIDGGSTWSAVSTTSFVSVENSDESLEFFGFQSLMLDSSDQIRFRFARSSNGANDGGLYPVTPPSALVNAGFSTVPSAVLAVYKQSNYPYRP